MDSYAKYKEVRDVSWEIFLEYGIDTLPVDVVALANNLDVQVVKNSEVHLLEKSQKAISLFYNNQWYIVYYETQDSKVLTFTLAHELGHIVLGHELIRNDNTQLTFNTSKPQTETDADMFAIRLLAPACVLWGLKLHHPREVSEICNISISAATHRFNRLQKLKKRNKFLTSPTEKKVFKQFERFINSYSEASE